MSGPNEPDDDDSVFEETQPSIEAPLEDGPTREGDEPLFATDADLCLALDKRRVCRTDIARCDQRLRIADIRIMQVVGNRFPAFRFRGHDFGSCFGGITHLFQHLYCPGLRDHARLF